MEEIILYSTHCPKCNVLTKKLDAKNISYTEITDTNVMREKGYMAVPVLEINGKALDFTEANNWINTKEDK